MSFGPVGAGDGRSPGAPTVEPTLVRTLPQVSGQRHRVPLEVRRRRTLLALLAIGSVAVALPFGGAGRFSHSAGPTLGASGRPHTYVVKPGDTLWTIAERIDPSGDPRPLVARLAARTGSDTVVPGERLVLP
ncbi:MAG: LysM peptidoglycan-binding domain-containing protein [Acidimicrobiales bacterium]